MSASPRPLDAGDRDAVTALTRAVGWPHRRADVGELIALGRGHAIRDGDGSLLAAGLWWPCGGAAATLGLIVVSPESQGRGLGRRLVEHLLAQAGPRSLLLTATAAGRPLYERLGFRTTGGIRQVQGTCTVAPAPDPRIRPARAADRDAILALDADAFGADRREAILRVLETGTAMVLVDGGTARGFAARRPFGRGEVVGPIVARDEEDATALFRAATRRGFIRVDHPAGATHFAAALAEHGLVEVDAPVAMVRGDWRGPGDVRLFGLINQALC